MSSKLGFLRMKDTINNYASTGMVILVIKKNTTLLVTGALLFLP